MNSLNSIIMEGILTETPMKSFSEKNTEISSFTIKTNRTFKKDGEDRLEESLFDIEAWSKLGENCNKFLTKGRGVRVVGRLSSFNETTLGGGVFRGTVIIAEHIEFKPIKEVS